VPSSMPIPRIVAVRLPSASPGPLSTFVPPEGVRSRPLLSVVVPVYNGGDEVVANVDVIREAVAAGLAPEDVELIVVSDGSIDGSAERLIESRGDKGIRVIHYDRNLGKGYAVKAGALASHGDWVGLVDADLDLDPALIPHYLEVARRERLDLAIGSKRHPDSLVQYPRSRRVASWCYQQLNRALFRLDVRDTQVGMKVFSRQVADEVVPLLLVKRFAFDLELLAVATSLGYDRIRELPVRLDYRFSGSGVRSLAVLGALWDTAAVYYRLRILRTYDRKRRLLRPGSAQPPRELPLVSLIGDAGAAELLDYPRLQVVRSDKVEDAARAAAGELVAVLDSAARPAGNWVTAAVPFFADRDVAAVIAPTVAPLRGPLRVRVAAAVLESRLGGGSRRSSYFPGNVRTVVDQAAESLVVRRADFLAALADGVDEEEIVAWLSARGRRTIYTPDTTLAVAPPPLIRPHLDGIFRHARARGIAASNTRGASLSSATALSLAPAAAALAGGALLLIGGAAQSAGVVLLVAYVGAMAASGIHAAARFRSFAVGLLEPPAVMASQVAYIFGFIRGVARRSR
jgi:glycosyltransferase involved in cell wall biosynthesis